MLSSHDEHASLDRRSACGSFVVLVARVLSTLAWQLSSAAQPPPPPPPRNAPLNRPLPRRSATDVFRTGINFVRVDVIVTDQQGNPVADLKQADFEVLEDGKPQTVETFRLSRSIAPRSGYAAHHPHAQRREIAAADENSRIFVFFLDDYHVRLGNSMAARSRWRTSSPTSSGRTISSP